MASVLVFFSLVLGIGTVLSLPLSANIKPAGRGDVVRMERAVRDPVLMYGDIAVKVEKRNAAPCSNKGCRWPNSSSMFVNIPVSISSEYTAEETNEIVLGLVSFHRATCIRFFSRTTETDYIYIFPGNGCWSYLGFQGGMQNVSLPNGCMSRRIMQHEILHALGFHHEQVREDRANYVSINMDNILPDKKHNFDKAESNNLITAYDYNSILQYGRYDFSKQPGVLETIVPVPNPNTVIGEAKVLSPLDINKVNYFYQCRKIIFKTRGKLPLSTKPGC